MCYVDNYYLSANTAARWYFNPQIPEARHLYGGYVPFQTVVYYVLLVLFRDCCFQSTK